jgi:uncharacterized protein
MNMKKRKIVKSEVTNSKPIYAMKRRAFTSSFLNNSVTTARSKALQQYLNPRIDMNFECRYPDNITIQEYTQMFARNGIATRIVNVMPEECWNTYPTITETEDKAETAFEADWNELEKNKHVLSYLQRIDVLSGVGEYGVLLLGLDDGAELSEPVQGISEKTGEKEGNAQHELLFLKALAQNVVTISEKNSDLTSARYGLPEIYMVEFKGSATNSSQTLRVHWSRLIHIADNRESSEIIGVPRMKNVYNYLLDIRKVLGGSGEMFWKGGFPGLSFETNPEPGQPALDTDSLEDQIEDYYNGMQRYLATEGLQVKSLQPQVSSPKDHVEANMRAIATTKGVPYRIFMGTEEGKLAGGQDASAWDKRVAGRQTKYVTPYVIRPLVDRLIAFGVLSEPKEYSVTWQDLSKPTASDEAEVADKLTSAMTKYVSGSVDDLIRPFEYFTMVLGFSDDEARAIEKSAMQWTDLDEPEPQDDVETFIDVDGGQTTKTKGKRAVPVELEKNVTKNKKNKGKKKAKK